MRTWVLIGMVAAFGVGCGSSGRASVTPRLAPSALAADFTLLDVNPASPTGGDAVSVRGQRGRVTAWYFGTAT